MSASWQTFGARGHGRFSLFDWKMLVSFPVMKFIFTDEKIFVRESVPVTCRKAAKFHLWPCAKFFTERSVFFDCQYILDIRFVCWVYFYPVWGINNRK